MLNRLRFIFLKRYHDVKPVTPNSGMFGWLDMQCNVFEAFTDDIRRYGLRIAVGNFLEMVAWRNSVYSK